MGDLEDENLISAYVLDGNGGGKTIGWQEIESWKKEDGILWVHLNYHSKSSQKWLIENSKIDPVIVEDMITPEIRPRCIVHQDGVSILLRGVNLNPGEEPEDMVSIRVWLDSHRIVTTRNRKVLSIQDLRNALKNNIGPKSPSDFVLMLNDRLIRRMGDVVNEVEDQVDALEDALEAHSNSDSDKSIHKKISDVRRQIIQLRRYLAPQREALGQLFVEDSVMFNDKQKLILQEITQRLVHYIEDLDSSRDRATVLQEELKAKYSEQLNQQMFLLSAATVFFLPLTFVTGLLGMNVSGIPRANDEFAFMAVCLMLTVVGLGVILLYKIKKWL